MRETERPRQEPEVVRVAPTPPATAPDPAAARPARPKQQRGWFEERLGLEALHRKYGRKAFPVHSTFFLGEMATFSFVILVLTGVYLGLLYVPSNELIAVGDEELPLAYQSVRLIESIPVANLFRNVHHWAAHLMVASILLHALRIFFTGTYRKPRELNWVFGVVLLGLTLMAGFVGYSLPYDSYAVTATGIGYALARSIPWVGNVAADLFFGGTFPTQGSLPRLYTIHIFIVPALIAGAMALHLLLVIKQKHTQPGYARPLAEPGRVLGVPLWPYQAILALQLLLLMFGGLFLLSAFIPVHPLEAYGPPGPATPEVKPDWYLLWIYGFLEMIPSGTVIALPGANIGPQFLGGVLFPAAIFGILTLVPWLDKTNRRATRRYEYLEPPRQSPTRLGWGIGLLVYIGMLCFAAFHKEVGLGLLETWILTLAIPLIVGAWVFIWAKRSAAYREANFDPTAEDEEDVDTSALDAPRAAPAD
jgi:cytochrome b-561